MYVKSFEICNFGYRYSQNFIFIIKNGYMYFLHLYEYIIRVCIKKGLLCFLLYFHEKEWEFLKKVSVVLHTIYIHTLFVMNNFQKLLMTSSILKDNTKF